MVEAKDSITAVNIVRFREYEQAQRKFVPHPETKPDFNAFAAALEVTPPETSDSRSVDAAGTTMVPGSSNVPGDGEAGFRQARIAVTAGLLVVLLLVWFYQRTR